MTKETKQIIMQALQQYRGDNYERAQAAFCNCSPEQMQQVWGANYETRQQVLDGYRKHVEAIERARVEILAL